MFLKQLALWSGFKEPIQCESSLTFLLLMHSFSCGINHPPAAEGPLQKHSRVWDQCVCVRGKSARERKATLGNRVTRVSTLSIVGCNFSFQSTKRKPESILRWVNSKQTRVGDLFQSVCIHLGKFDRAFFVVSLGVFTVRFTSYRLIFVERFLRLISLRSCSWATMWWKREKFKR